jgi:hypothetical protein
VGIRFLTPLPVSAEMGTTGTLRDCRSPVSTLVSLGVVGGWMLATVVVVGWSVVECVVYGGLDDVSTSNI